MQDYICTCIFLGRGVHNFNGIQVFMNTFRSMAPIIAAKLLDDLPTEFYKLRSSFLAQCCIWSLVYWLFWASVATPVAKNPLANAGEAGSIPGSGRYPGEGNRNPLRIPVVKAHTQRSLVTYSPWGHKESNLIYQLKQPLPACQSIFWGQTSEDTGSASLSFLSFGAGPCIMMFLHFL